MNRVELKVCYICHTADPVRLHIPVRKSSNLTSMYNALRKPSVLGIYKISSISNTHTFSV